MLVSFHFVATLHTRSVLWFLISYVNYYVVFQNFNIVKMLSAEAPFTPSVSLCQTQVVFPIADWCPYVVTSLDMALSSWIFSYRSNNILRLTCPCPCNGHVIMGIWQRHLIQKLCLAYEGLSVHHDLLFLDIWNLSCHNQYFSIKSKK